MTTMIEQIVDMIFSLSDGQLKQFRKWVDANTKFDTSTKEAINKVIDNAYKNMNF